LGEGRNLEIFVERQEKDWNGYGEDTTWLGIGYKEDSLTKQTQLLLGQPGRCLQVLRGHPRRVSVLSTSLHSLH
jgi:hypothetical protein